MREPPFWWRAAGTTSMLLAPLAATYGAVAVRRLARPGLRVGAPVVCIGNFIVGGAGKTPAALAVARILQSLGENPVFLGRGYGGAMAGPLRVDPLQHRAADVGDEALLLARAATTIVARDRALGAHAAIAAGADAIVMDDGFQNPSLVKDLSIVVVDGRRGVGNGRVIPAGPLRAPLAAQLDRAHALIVVGTGAHDIVAQARNRNLPVFGARLEPDAGFVAALGAGRVLAFAGIGDPDKFFATLREAGIDVAVSRRFADHHRYTQAEAQSLCDDADREGLVLVTTEKDLARMQGDDRNAQLAAHAHALPVALVLDDEVAFTTMLRERMAAARARSRGLHGMDAS